MNISYEHLTVSVWNTQHYLLFKMYFTRKPKLFKFTEIYHFKVHNKHEWDRKKHMYLLENHHQFMYPSYWINTTGPETSRQVICNTSTRYAPWATCQQYVKDVSNTWKMSAIHERCRQYVKDVGITWKMSAIRERGQQYVIEDWTKYAWPEMKTLCIYLEVYDIDQYIVQVRKMAAILLIVNKPTFLYAL